MLDISFLLGLQSFRDKTQNLFDGLFLYITEFGEPFAMLLLIAAIYWCFDKKMGIFMMFSFNLNFFLNSLLKNIFCINRPWIRDPRVKPVKQAMYMASGFSFPSGHTMNITSVLGTVPYTQKKNKLLSALCISFCVLLAFSRNYLGVHTPQDVIIGLILGTAVIFIADFLMKFIDKKPNADIIVLVLGLLLNIALLLICKYKSYPSSVDAAGKPILNIASLTRNVYLTIGAGFGFLIGWFIERRFIKFSTDANCYQKITRFLIGAAIIAILYKVGYSAFRLWLGKNWGGAVSQFVNFIFIMLYPAFFKKSK